MLLELNDIVGPVLSAVDVSQDNALLKSCTNHGSQRVFPGFYTSAFPGQKRNV